MTEQLSSQEKSDSNIPSQHQAGEAILVPRSPGSGRRGGNIEVWNLTGHRDEKGNYFAQSTEPDVRDGKISFPGKWLHERALADDIQGRLAEELAASRPGITPEQMERGEQLNEFVVEDLGEEAVEATGIEEPEHEEALPEEVIDQPETEAEVKLDLEKSDEAIKAEIIMSTAEYKHRIERTIDQLAQDAKSGIRGIEGDIEEATGYLSMLVRMVEDASTALDKGWRQYDNGSYSEQTLVHVIDDARNSLHGSISRLAYANGFSSTVHTRLGNLAQVFNQGKERLSTSEHDFDAWIIGMKASEKPTGTSTEQTQAEVDKWLEAVDEISQSLPKGELVPEAAGTLRMVSNMLDELESQLRQGRFNRDQVVNDMRGAVSRLKNVMDNADMIRKRPMLDSDVLEKLSRNIRQI